MGPTGEPPLGFDFKSGEKAEERAELAAAEIELLERVRFTETYEELDTLTVTNELVKDPEVFIRICSNIVGTNFLRIAPTFEGLTSQGRFSTGFPVWM
jgi:hypothetical protein